MKGLMAAICRDEHSALASWCRDQLGSAAALLLSRAQRFGAVRPDVSPWQLLRLINGIVLAGEQSGAGDEETRHLLMLVIDGLRYRDT